MARSRVSIKIDGKTIAAATEFARFIFEAAGGNRAQPPTIPNRDPYELLGLPKNATEEQIRTRYHQLSQIFHPDKQGGNHEAMKRLNEAYNLICNPRRLSA